MPAILTPDQRESICNLTKTILDQNSALIANADDFRSLLAHIHAAAYSSTAEYAIQWNAHSIAPIGKLPAELLVRVFEHLDLRDCFNIRRISHAWNSAADAPSIWNNITLEHGAGARTAKWLEWRFARSGDASIDLQIRGFSEQLLPPLQAVMSRVRHLEVHSQDPSPTAVAEMLKEPASRLESLRLLGHTRRPDGISAPAAHICAFPEHISPDGLCSLRVLAVGLFTLPEQATWTIPTLRTFNGTVASGKTDIKNLFKFFPHLDKLDLWAQRFDTIPDGPFPALLHDLALRSRELLNLADVRQRIAHPLKRLTLDHLEDLHTAIDMFLRAVDSTRTSSERRWTLMECNGNTKQRARLRLRIATLDDGEDVDGSSVDRFGETVGENDHVYHVTTTYAADFTAFVKSDFGRLVTSSTTLTVLILTVHMVNALLCCGHSVDMPAVRSFTISMHETLHHTLVFVAEHVGSDQAGAALDARTLRLNALTRVSVLFYGTKLRQFSGAVLQWCARDLPLWLGTALWWERPRLERLLITGANPEDKPDMREWMDIEMYADTVEIQRNVRNGRG